MRDVRLCAVRVRSVMSRHRTDKPPCTVCSRPSVARGLCPTCYQRARRRGNGDARPPPPRNGLCEAQLQVTGPALLLAAVEARAEALGIPVREAWRRAARAWLGWREVTLPPHDGSNAVPDASADE